MSYAPAAATRPSQEMSVLPDMSMSGARAAPQTPMEDGKPAGDSFDTEASKLSDVDLLPQNGNAQEEEASIKKGKAELPHLDFHNGVGPFFSSFGRRVAVSMTPRLALCLVAGQLLSICITCTSVVTTELGMGGWSLPATQTFFVYAALMGIYTPLTIYKYGVGAWGKMLTTDGWKYGILGTIDVFGNFLTVFGFRYTNLLSCLLLGAWSTPVSMVVTYFLLKARYTWVQLAGVCICIGGLGVLVASDIRTGKDWGYANKGKGDAFMIAGATLYGLSNGFEEYLVRGRPHYEVVGALGLVGFIVNGILVGGYEHATVYESAWTGRNVGLLMAYVSAMVILYSVAPLLFRFASAPFYNISLMTSDFYSLLFGLFLFHYKPYFLYFIAYPMVLIGLLTYFLAKAPEGHAVINVVSRGKQLEREERSGHYRVIGDPKGGFGSVL